MTTLPHSISPPPVTLFVVDDDEVDRETIVRSVEDMGLDNPVRTARDGEVLAHQGNLSITSTPANEDALDHSQRQEEVRARDRH